MSINLSIKANRKLFLLATCFLWLSACTLIKSHSAPSIVINKVPASENGGSGKLVEIGGAVTGNLPGEKIVLYARNGDWWIQPFVKKPFTEIQPDATWKNLVHLGTEYAAILVKPTYLPPPKVSELPVLGNGVIAISIIRGAPPNTSESPAKAIEFSGYEWVVYDEIRDPGGTVNVFDPANVWTDEKGYLHLRIANKDGRWTSAEISLTRSLGYGTYKIVVQDVTPMDAAAVLSMFTWDSQAEEHHRAMKVEISRWGDPGNKNLQYVIDPYNIPANTVRFSIPSGVITHTLRWEPGVAAFKSAQVENSNKRTPTVAQFDFMSGIPTPKAETLHLNLFVFGNAKIPLQKETEVVIEKFEYLP